MAHSYHEIAFTPTILDLQSQAGSRAANASMSEGERYAQRLSERETSFISKRDSFYMASVSETGWPYVQHRGGPAGFMKVLDETTIGFADYSGNRQYVSSGNLRRDDRVSLFFMDYPNRRRLKMFGRVRQIGLEDSETLERLEDAGYGAQIERGFLITVEGFDWNCPAHITPRFTEAEVRSSVEALVAENRALKLKLDQGAASKVEQGDESASVLGDGPLELVISGVRQLTPRVRAYEFRDPTGAALPPVSAGAHLPIPVRMPNGELSERQYSIASNPARRDAYEIAVQREDERRGGSRAVHESFAIGTQLQTRLAENHFPLHEGKEPALLIAGGIGITAIKPMAQTLQDRGTEFELHYAGKRRHEMAFLDRLERQLEDRLRVYAADESERLDLPELLRNAPANAIVYICGPERMIAGAMEAARETGFPRDRIRTERFA